MCGNEVVVLRGGNLFPFRGDAVHVWEYDLDFELVTTDPGFDKKVFFDNLIAQGLVWEGDDAYVMEYNSSYPTLLKSIWNPSLNVSTCFEHGTTRGAWEVIFLADMADFRYDVYFQYIPEDVLFDGNGTDSRGRRRLTENYLRMEMDGYEAIISKDCFKRCLNMYKPGPKMVGMSAEPAVNTTKAGMPLKCNLPGHNACLPECTKYGVCEFPDRFARADWWST